MTGISRTTVGDARLRPPGTRADRRACRTAGRSPPGAAGRRVLLRLDAAAGAALGIDFGHRHVRVAVADLSSTVLAERVVELDVDGAPPRRARRRRRRSSRAVLAEAGRRPRPRRSAPAWGCSGRSTAHRARRLVGDPARLGRHPAPARSSRAGSASRSSSTTTPTSARWPRSRSAPGAALDDVVYVEGVRRHRRRARPRRPPVPRRDRHRRGSSGTSRCARTAPSAAAATAAAWRPSPRPARCSTLLRPAHGPDADAAATARARRRRRPRRAARRQRRRPRGRPGARRPLQLPQPGGDRRRRRPERRRRRRCSTASARRSSATRCPARPRRWRSRPACWASAPRCLGAIALVIADTDRLRSAGLAPIGTRRLAPAAKPSLADPTSPTRTGSGGCSRRAWRRRRRSGDREALVRHDASREQGGAADRRGLADVAVGADRGGAADLRAGLDGDVRAEDDRPVDHRRRDGCGSPPPPRRRARSPRRGRRRGRGRARRRGSCCAARRGRRRRSSRPSSCMRRPPPRPRRASARRPRRSRRRCPAGCARAAPARSRRRRSWRGRTSASSRRGFSWKPGSACRGRG